MSKITISDLQVNPSFDVADDELYQVQGGLGGAEGAGILAGIALGAAAVAFPVAATVAAGAAVISAGVGIYEALNN